MINSMNFSKNLNINEKNILLFSISLNLPIGLLHANACLSEIMSVIFLVGLLYAFTYHLLFNGKSSQSSISQVRRFYINLNSVVWNLFLFYWREQACLNLSEMFPNYHVLQISWKLLS